MARARAKSRTTVAEPPRSNGGPQLPPGLPTGLIERGAKRWRDAEALASRAGLRPPDLDDAELAERLVTELTAPLRLEDWPAPTEPVPVTGGWIHDEVVDDDRSAFDALRAARPGHDAESLATAAQELRWPVCPYRQLPDRSEVRIATTESGPTVGANRDSLDRSAEARSVPPRSRPPLVIDLTTHWAGPLSTALLAESGAEVIKIDPDCRPDGFRGRPALYHHLNQAKTIVDLDLRDHDDRQRFEAMLADADLLVESFSRRVLSNLGYDQDRLASLNPRLALLSIKAFPSGSPEADWLAYGPGVHATSGLGWLPGASHPTPAPVAYPDLLAGLGAYAEAVALLGRSVEEGSPSITEVSLAGSIAPLVELAIEATGATDD